MKVIRVESCDGCPEFDCWREVKGFSLQPLGWRRECRELRKRIGRRQKHRPTHTPIPDWCPLESE